MGSQVVSLAHLRGGGQGARITTEPPYLSMECEGKQAGRCVTCTHPTQRHNRTWRGSSHCARELAFTHVCDQAKLLMQTFNILSKVLFTQIACLLFQIVPKIVPQISRGDIIKPHKISVLSLLCSFYQRSSFSPSFHPPFLLLPKLSVPPSPGRSMLSSSSNMARYLTSGPQSSPVLWILHSGNMKPQRVRPTLTVWLPLGCDIQSLIFSF